MEGIGHGIALYLVGVWEHIPPIKILNLPLTCLICFHVNLIMQTVKVLTNDENGAEEYENAARLTINSLIGRVNCEECHVSQIVDAIQIKYTLNEQRNEDDNVSPSARKEQPNIEYRLIFDLIFEESDQAIFLIFTVDSLNINRNHHVEQKQGQEHEELLQHIIIHGKSEVLSI
jgi:hypothetical protein